MVFHNDIIINRKLSNNKSISNLSNKRRRGRNSKKNKLRRITHMVKGDIKMIVIPAESMGFKGYVITILFVLVFLILIPFLKRGD